MDKTKFRVISAKKKPAQRIDAYFYGNALLRLFQRCGDLVNTGDWREYEEFKKSLFLIVRFIRYGMRNLRETVSCIEDARQRMNLMFAVLDMISLLTPRELLQMFPVEKQYDGKKYQEKDYFYTMEKLQSLDMDKIIQEQIDVFKFLMDYLNIDIDSLMVEVMMAMSTLRQFQGKLGIMEEFMEDHGVTPLILHEKEGYLYAPFTGGSQPVSKPKKRVPKWMKIIDGESFFLSFPTENTPPL